MNGFRFHHRIIIVTFARTYLLNSNLIFRWYCIERKYMNVIQWLTRQTYARPNCEKNKKKKKYDSFDNDGSEFFSPHRVFTQKSTLIFAQIEFCVFFFQFFRCCCFLFVCRSRHGKWKMRYAHTDAASCHSKAQPYSWQWDDDDDGWRAFHWNFYGGQESCGGTCICIRNTWHTGTFRTQEGAKKTLPLPSWFILCKEKKNIMWIFDSAICTTKWLMKWKSYSVPGSHSNHIAFGNGNDYLFTHWFHYYLFSFRAATPFSRIHLCSRCLADTSERGK